MVDWFKFYWLKLKLMFRSKKKMARADVNSFDVSESEYISGGGGLPNEERVAKEYHALGEVSFSKWLNLLVPVFVMLAGAMVWQAIMGVGDLSQNYYAMANIAGLVLAMLGIVWLSVKKPVLHVSKEEYEKAKEWLHCTGEGDYAPMGMGKILLIVLGLGLEAYAIGVVIAAAATAGQISEDFAGKVGVFIGAGIAALLAWVSHHAGASLYKATTRRSIKETIQRQQKRGDDELLKKLAKQDPHFESRFLGEITFFQKFGWLVMALGLTLLIGGGAFYERYNLNWEYVYADSGGPGGDAVAFSAAPAGLPDALAVQESQADSALDQQIKQHEMNGIVAALAILFLLLLGMNMLGVLFGYQHSLAFRKSEESWRKAKAYHQLELRGAEEEAEKLAGWAMVVADANQWFGKYHDVLLARAVEQGEDALRTALNRRKAFKMEFYLKHHVSRGNG